MAVKKSGIKAWPEEERPREKLFRCGEHNLSSAELLAIILGSGTRGEDALAMARRILAKFGSFREMSHTDPRAWKEFKGLGAAKLARVKAALEVGHRLREEKIRDKRPRVSGPKDVAEIIQSFMSRMQDLKNEVFKVVYLDGRNRVITVQEIAEGTPNSAHPLIRSIISYGIQHFAAGIIALHNHPSGEPDPSQEDREFTDRLREACTLVNIRLLDHIVYGDSSYFSFSETGLI